MSVSSRKSLASRSKRQMGSGCLRLFFVPLCLLGAGIFYGLTIHPALKILAARSWVETPCVIDSSEVESHPGSKGSRTYNVAITYHYSFADQEYKSNRYNFGSGSSGGRKAKDAVVQKYHRGTEAVCFVDPKKPSEAVLNRDWFGELGFGAIGLAFALVGGLGMIFAGKMSRQTAPSPTGLPTTPMPTGAPEVLRPKYTPLARFLGILIFALFWNGIIGTIGYFMIFSEDSRAPIFVKILLGLFGVIGVGILVAAFTQFLALFNPRIHITAASTMVSLGGELNFTWTVSGRAGVLSKLRIVLEGAESATYRRGTNTSTDRKVFVEIPVFESREREFLSQGGGRAVVPANLMHTFEAPNNKVQWQLKVTGEIPRWPDVVDEYAITVLPLSARA